MPLGRSTEGPIPGISSQGMEQDLELQREVEASMMEHLAEENEKLKEEIRCLREGRGTERSYQRRTEAEAAEVGRSLQRRTEAEKTEVEAGRRFAREIREKTQAEAEVYAPWDPGS